MPGEQAATTASFTGQHVLAEFTGADPALLDDAASLRARLEDALRRAGATVCDMVSKEFSPHGVTVVALLAESHASLHTYPENGSAFFDVFTCGTRADPVLAAALLARSIGAASTTSRVVRRSLPPGPGAPG